MVFENYNFGLVGFSQRTAKSFDRLGMKIASHIYSNDKNKKKQTSLNSTEINFHDWKSYKYVDNYNHKVSDQVLLSAKKKYIDEFIRCTDRWPWSSELINNWNDYDHLFNISCHQALGWFKQNNINCAIYSNVPHQGAAIAQYAIAKELGIKTLIFNQTLFPGKTWLVEDWIDLGHFKTSALTEGFNVNISPPKAPPFYMNSINSASKRKIKNTLHLSRARLLVTLGLTGFTPEQRKAGFKRNAKRWQIAVEQKRYLKQSEKLFSDKPSEENYVYFPLHLQPEMTTDVLGGIYADQLLALETLREIVPLKIPIYVKENPKQTGLLRSEAFFKRLKKIQNIKLLSKDVPSFELIQKSSLVSTITGTAGWEALRMAKPVIVFGSIFWSQFPGAFHISRKPCWTQIEKFIYNNKALQDYANKIGKYTHDGVCDFDYSKLIEKFDEDKNAERLAAAIKANLQA